MRSQLKPFARRPRSIELGDVSMRMYLRRLVGGVVGPIVVGAVLGAFGTVLFAQLCPGVYWVIDPGLDQKLAFSLTLGAIGAIAGALVGLCVAVDRDQQENTPEPRPKLESETLVALRGPINPCCEVEVREGGETPSPVAPIVLDRLTSIPGNLFMQLGLGLKPPPYSADSSSLAPARIRLASPAPVPTSSPCSRWPAGNARFLFAAS